MGKKQRMRKYKKENTDLVNDITEVNAQKAQAKEMAAIKDDDLFVINEGKTEDIKAAREKLAADRFKQYNKERSKYERDQIKKLMKKPNITETKPKKKKTEKDNLFDIWNTPEEEMGMKKISKNKMRDRDILNKSKDNIKRVVLPHAGHSYNPPAAEHKKVIDQVVVEEIEDIRKEKKLEEELNPSLRPDMQNLDEEIAKLKEYCQKKEEKCKFNHLMQQILIY